MQNLMSYLGIFSVLCVKNILSIQSTMIYSILRFSDGDTGKDYFETDVQNETIIKL